MVSVSADIQIQVSDRNWKKDGSVQQLVTADDTAVQHRKIVFLFSNSKLNTFALLAVD